MTFISKLISTFFGVGLFPYAPGTMGSLAIVIIYWFLPEMNSLELSALIVFVSLLGVYTATITEKEFVNKLGVEGHDPGIIVIDEVAGMLIALIAIPKNIYYVIAAFILFRIFDILKPFPIKQFEKLPKGWGIMFDDIVAGIYANIILQIIIFLFIKNL